VFWLYVCSYLIYVIWQTQWGFLSFLYHASFQHMKWKSNRCHYFNFIHISTDLYTFQTHRPIFRRVHTAVHTTIGSYSICTVQAMCSVWTYGAHDLNGTDTVRTNACVNSPEDGPVGPKRVEIRRYMNKIEIVTSVGFSFHTMGVTLLKVDKRSWDSTSSRSKSFSLQNIQTGSGAHPAPHPLF